MQRSLLALAIASLGVSSVNALTFTVTEENDNGLANTPGTLSYAIRQANDPNGHASREDGSKGLDTIEFQTDITVTAPMLALIDSDITIVGNGHTLSGGKLHRPLFIKSGSVKISDLTIEDGLAKGQNTGRGGAGAGMGGGLFIFDGDVSLKDVAFNGNRAFGGKSRQYRTSNYYVGGGMQPTNPLAESRVEIYGDSSFGSSLFGDAEKEAMAVLAAAGVTVMPMEMIFVVKVIITAVRLVMVALVQVAAMVVYEAAMVVLALQAVVLTMAKTIMVQVVLVL